MSAIPNASATQPVELSLLVDLEARWENLRAGRAVNPAKQDTVTHLHQIQRAYEAFHAKLVAYNKTFQPVHTPELLLNTPHRLREWCRKMRELHARADAVYPLHLMEKAYRSAVQVASRLKKDPMPRPDQSAHAPSVVRELDALVGWCDSVLT